MQWPTSLLWLPFLQQAHIANEAHQRLKNAPGTEKVGVLKRVKTFDTLAYYSPYFYINRNGRGFHYLWKVHNIQRKVLTQIDANICLCICLSFLWISDLVDEYQQYQEATVDEDDDDEDNYDDED